MSRSVDNPFVEQGQSSHPKDRSNLMTCCATAAPPLSPWQNRPDPRQSSHQPRTRRDS